MCPGLRDASGLGSWKLKASRATAPRHPLPQLGPRHPQPGHIHMGPRLRPSHSQTSPVPGPSCPHALLRAEHAAEHRRIETAGAGLPLEGRLCSRAPHARILSWHLRRSVARMPTATAESNNHWGAKRVGGPRKNRPQRVQDRAARDSTVHLLILWRPHHLSRSCSQQPPSGSPHGCPRPPSP